MQKALEKDAPGATVIPIIISSDKTQLTQFRNKTAYPIYLTIANFPKDIRSKPSQRGQILLGYLPTTKLEQVQNKAARRRMLANLFHASVSRILEPLRELGEKGVPIMSGDGISRRVHPILAAFVGNYPEQVLVTGISLVTAQFATAIETTWAISTFKARYEILRRHYASFRLQTNLRLISCANARLRESSRYTIPSGTTFHIPTFSYLSLRTSSTSCTKVS